MSNYISNLRNARRNEAPPSDAPKKPKVRESILTRNRRKMPVADDPDADESQNEQSHEDAEEDMGEEDVEDDEDEESSDEDEYGYEYEDEDDDEDRAESSEEHRDGAPVGRELHSSVSGSSSLSSTDAASGLHEMRLLKRPVSAQDAGKSRGGESKGRSKGKQ